MKRLLSAAIVAMAASAPAWAQSSTATGTGVGVARSTSNSQAISGQGGAATIVSNSSAPADQTVRNVPSVFAPGLAAAGLETCLGSVSGGGAFVGTGFSFGTTVPDPGCAARLDARTLWSMGLKKAAVARLCLNSDIYRAMPEICEEYLPRAQGNRAPPPVPTRHAQAEASDDEPYTGGNIWLVEGATGKTRLCSDYDVAQQSCRIWAHPAHHSTPKKRATESGETARTVPKKKPAESGEDPHTAPSPAPTPASTPASTLASTLALAETEKKEKSQVERIERVDLSREVPSLALYNHRCSSLPLLSLLGPCAARGVFATITM